MTMELLQGIQLAVESPREDTWVIRAAGDLTAVTGRRLRALLDRNLATSTTTVVVDLGNVRSFEVEGIEIHRHAGRRLGHAGVRLVLAGLDAHRGALPGRIGRALDVFDTVPGLEEAFTEPPS
jgi:anti-anti-sigma regulatory factor